MIERYDGYERVSGYERVGPPVPGDGPITGLTVFEGRVVVVTPSGPWMLVGKEWVRLP